MRIFGLTRTTNSDVHTLSAKVEWEDNDRPGVEVFFRIYGERELMNASNYNAFLVACVTPALHYGERRISIDGEVCPWLADNLTTMMAYLNHWYWYDQGRRPGDTVKIEAKPYVYHDPTRRPRVAAFFSGGVDSLYTLRKNRLTLPEGHPGRISDIIFLHGFDVFGNRPKRGAEEDAFRYFLKEIEPVAQDAKVNVIPVWTNLRMVGMEDTGAFLRESFGATLGAVAHALSGKLTDILVASDYDIQHLRPWGSNPLTDPRLSSFSLRVQWDGERVSRLDKVRAIGDWQVGLDHLRVCFLGGPGTLNCGECEKCIRTKLALLCVNRLHSTKAFRNGEISPGLVLRGFIANDANIPFFDELIHALAKAGHGNLARAVALKRLQYYLLKAVDLRGMLTWVDKNVFRGLLKAWYRRLKRHNQDCA